MEVCWWWHPSRPLEEERLGEDHAAHHVICSWIGRDAPVVLDPFPHLLVIPRAVLDPERIPGEAHGQGRKVCKEAPARDEVQGRVKFEEQRLANLQGAERFAARRPE